MQLLLSFAVGGLLADVFLHLLPEAWTTAIEGILFYSKVYFEIHFYYKVKIFVINLSSVFLNSSFI